MRLSRLDLVALSSRVGLRLRVPRYKLSMTPLESELLKSKPYLFDWRYGVSLYKDAVAYKVVLRGKDMHALISGRPENFLVMLSSPTRVTVFRRRSEEPVQSKSYTEYLRRWNSEAHQYFAKEVHEDALIKVDKTNFRQVSRVLEEFMSNVENIRQEDERMSESIKLISDCRDDINSFFSIDWSQPAPHVETAIVSSA